MLRLSSRITILNIPEKGETTSYNIDFVKNVEVTSSWEIMADYAEITLPKNVYVRIDGTLKNIAMSQRTIGTSDPTKQAQKSSTPLFKVGDPIKIELGYDLNYERVFSGVITEIGSGVPIKLKCIDFMWVLNTVGIKKDSFETASPTLTEVMNELAKAYNDSPIKKTYEKWFKLEKDANTAASTRGEKPEQIGFDIKFTNTLSTPEKDLNPVLDKFKIQNQTIYEVLNKIKEILKIEVYMRGYEVCCGNPYDKRHKTDGKKLFAFDKNIISADELKNKSKEDTHVEINATVINDTINSTKPPEKVVATGDVSLGEAASAEASTTAADISAIAGNIENSSRAKKTFFKFFNLDQGSLAGILQNNHDKMRYDGFSGSFTTFGKPLVKHGDTIDFEDSFVPERNGKYLVKKIVYTFGEGGYRQKIEPHLKLKEEEK